MRIRKLTLTLNLFLLSLIIICGCQKRINTPASIENEDNTVLAIDSSLYNVSELGGQDTGKILLAENTNDTTTGNLLILDQRGFVETEKVLDARVDDFQQWTINGQTRYTYQLSPLPNNMGGPATVSGYGIICDSNLNVLSTAKFLSPGNIDDPTNDKLDLHDFILLGDNHYMGINAQIKSPTNVPDSLNPSSKLRVISWIIQEVNNGQVVFQWDATNYPELYSSSIENNNFSDSVDVMDYLHINSICIDPGDNNIIASFRNLNEVVKINRVTGAIIWRLGGPFSDFPLSPDEVFLRQHYVRLTDNNQTLIMVDNGQIALRPFSRIDEFQLDEIGKKINNFKSYYIPDNFIQYEGSVKKANGNYFIGGGSANYALQINYTTGQVYLRLNQLFYSYRALKY